MAVFTGEKRGASVEAETDMDVLSMSSEKFEALSQEYPEFRGYLSEIVTHRLSTSKITAEKKVGKYTITEKIGDGGSSIIYKGIHSILKLPVAIKMLKHEMAMDPDFINVFSNEAKIIAQLNHPRIVRIYDIEELYRTVFIVMEYLEGITFRQMLDITKKLPLSKPLALFSNWDQRIVNWAADEFKKDQGIDMRADHQALQRLREAAEKAKVELSSVTETEINLPYVTADAS